MLTDVAELRDFYASDLGVRAQTHLQALVRKIWPDVRQQSVLALGYGTPLISSFAGEAERVMAFMPAQQGVVHWPSREGKRNLTALVDPCHLPLPDASVDRVLLIHLLETAPDINQLMQELWRITSGRGRLVAVVPNRSGFWAISDSTPFGHGTSFSSAQLNGLMRKHNFIPEQEHHALFAPPFSSRFWLRMSPLWEQAGQRGFGAFAGVRALETSKRIYVAAGDVPAHVSQRIVPISRPAPAGLRVR